jgi:hypothetical protein
VNGRDQVSQSPSHLGRNDPPWLVYQGVTSHSKSRRKFAPPSIRSSPRFNLSWPNSNVQFGPTQHTHRSTHTQTETTRPGSMHHDQRIHPSTTLTLILNLHHITSSRLRALHPKRRQQHTLVTNFGAATLTTLRLRLRFG